MWVCGGPESEEFIWYSGYRHIRPAETLHVSVKLARKTFSLEMLKDLLYTYDPAQNHHNGRSNNKIMRHLLITIPSRYLSKKLQRFELFKNRLNTVLQRCKCITSVITEIHYRNHSFVKDGVIHCRNWFFSKNHEKKIWIWNLTCVR